MPEITVFAVIFKVFKVHLKCRKLYFITKVYSKQIKTPFFDENGQGGDDDKQGSKILSIIMITAAYRVRGKFCYGTKDDVETKLIIIIQFI